MHNLLSTSVIWVLIITPIVVSERSFHLEETWPDVAVSELEVYGSGAVLDSANNLIVLHRSDIMKPGAPVNQKIVEDVVLVLDYGTGKILRTWGKNMFFWPHGIEITEEGHLFVTDSRLHQVFKFEANTTTQLWNESPILTLGERFVPGNDPTHFCTPADVALMPDGSGDFFVADGYCNSRIVKFDQDGNYLMEFSAGTNNLPGDAPTPFNITHSVCVARGSGDKFLVFVADRDNSRIQAFDAKNGSFLYEMDSTRLGSGGAMMFGTSYADVDHSKPPYDSGVASDFGLLYAVYGNLPVGQAKVLELMVDYANATMLSSFPISPDGNGEGYEAPHDIKVSKDGKTVFVVVSELKLILKKFVMKWDVDNGAGSRTGLNWGLVIMMMLGVYGIHM